MELPAANLVNSRHMQWRHSTLLGVYEQQRHSNVAGYSKRDAGIPGNTGSYQESLRLR